GEDGDLAAERHERRDQPRRECVPGLETRLTGRWTHAGRRYTAKGSASEKLRRAAGQRVEPPPLLEPPPVRDAQTFRMVLAEVVAVWVADVRELVEPGHRAGVLVGQRGHRG